MKYKLKWNANAVGWTAIEDKRIYLCPSFMESMGFQKEETCLLHVLQTPRKGFLKVTLIAPIEGGFCWEWNNEELAQHTTCDHVFLGDVDTVLREMFPDRCEAALWVKFSKIESYET